MQTILSEYVPTYVPMTLRQIFSRLVASVAFPKTELAYGKLSNHVTSARRAQPIPFEHFRDDGNGSTSRSRRRPVRVTVMSAGGFDGLAGKHDLAKDVIPAFRNSGRPTRLLHIGDHDPSGVHIYSTLAEDVAAFVDAKVDADVASSPNASSCYLRRLWSSTCRPRQPKPKITVRSRVSRVTQPRLSSARH